MNTHYPYVVSQDIDILLNQWAKQHEFQIPNDKFFNKLRQSYAQMMTHLFPNFIYLSANKIKNDLHQIIEAKGINPVSLDQVYFPSKIKLSLTRTVNEKFQDLGINQRAEDLPLEQQLQIIINTKVKEVVLVDDVIFTGGLLSQMRNKLQTMGIQVPLAYAGIGIGNGIKRLKAEGLKVHCVHYYPKVIDQVCERDFFLGVPSCGRTLIDNNGLIWGVPYIKPFGNPNWASIPEKDQDNYSRFCLKQSIKLWKEIEKVSNKSILCQDLPRPIIGLPVNEQRFTDLLQQYL